MGNNQPKTLAERAAEIRARGPREFKAPPMPRVTPKSAGCCGGCIKMMIGCMSTLVYGFNFFFFLLGVCVLAVGIYAQTQLGDLATLLNVPLSIVMIVLGASVMVLTFFGCVGAYCQKRGLLKVYWGLLLLVVILQIVGGLVIYLTRDNLIDDMSDSWHSATPSLRKMLQQKFDCCGWHNYTDYPTSSPQCPVDLPDNPPTDQPPPVPGCQKAITDFFNDQILVLEITAIVVSSIQVSILIFSFCLIFLIRPDRDDYEAEYGYERVRMLDEL